MTTRHLVIGLMQHMRAKTHQQCEIALGLPGGSFSRMYNLGADVSVASLSKMQQRSGLSFDQLMAWYRQDHQGTISRASANDSDTRRRRGPGESWGCSD